MFSFVPGLEPEPPAILTMLTSLPFLLSTGQLHQQVYSSSNLEAQVLGAGAEQISA